MGCKPPPPSSLSVSSLAPSVSLGRYHVRSHNWLFWYWAQGNLAYTSDASAVPTSSRFFEILRQFTAANFYLKVV